MSAPTPEDKSKDIVEASHNERDNDSLPTDRRPQNAIANGQVVIFSKSWCPYSTRAKALFKDKYSDAKLTVLELDETDDGERSSNLLAEEDRSEDQQKHVGGCDDLFALHEMDGVSKLLD
ncbi:hypothetical protein EDB83DRAFT_2309979 [Lactarius deliciosus]|nr:hypothetical protein EDB83DRAFT_2309979 [Lactarius deliciosus]